MRIGVIITLILAMWLVVMPVMPVLAQATVPPLTTNDLKIMLADKDIQIEFMARTIQQLQSENQSYKTRLEADSCK